MSIVVLARKTKTVQRAKSNKQGSVLNMTNRGGGIGINRSSNYYCNQSLNTNVISKPAPQISYRAYLNKKTTVASLTGGNLCCKEVVNKPNNNVCKYHPNKLASELTESRRLETLKCDKETESRSETTNKITAKTPCYVKETVCMKSLCVPYKARLGYTRINHNKCNSTKNLEVNNCASDHINTLKQKTLVKC